MNLRASRRYFLASLGAAAASTLSAEPPEPVIDIHQHTNYTGRSNADLIKHQRKLGVTKTVLLPAGAYYGLDASCGGNDSVLALARKHPESFLFFANELPYLNTAKQVIESFLKKGGVGIGEQKFRVLADSAYLERMAGIARDFNVPILLHFWDGDYNMELQRFHKILEKFPTVNFIGHAQTWWGHIDANHNPRVMYPKGTVTPGGLTDRLLGDYSNMFGDLSAGSGLNALTRDPEHTRGFFERHQDKLLFGSDCPDSEGAGLKCTGAGILKAVRDLAPSKAIERKILYGNAKKLLKL
jgi:predicted TIM-barrel fold metal-dependent hydrolase